VSVPALGLSVGRISSHVDVHGDATGTVSNVTVTLHDVDLGTPAIPGVAFPTAATGTSVLHIGALVVTATTQRAAGAAHATARSSFEASGVTVAGQGARLDQNGLSLAGTPSLFNPTAATLWAQAQQVVTALNARFAGCAAQPPVELPGAGSVTSQPSIALEPPSVKEQPSHNGNEDTVDVSGPTLCIVSGVPIPGSNGFAVTPTVYTITLGSVSSSAYGISFPADDTTAFSPALNDNGGSGVGVGAGVDTTTTVTQPGGVSGGGSTPAPTAAHPTTRPLYAVLTGGILSKRVVVTVAVVAELALLGTLWASWLAARSARRRVPDDSPATRMDLV
jgi:hypothetical protein